MMTTEKFAPWLASTVTAVADVLADTSGGLTAGRSVFCWPR
ncbi:hypothetical protein ACFYT4_31855 [Streptomyces sp. NPDC004609]